MIDIQDRNNWEKLRIPTTKFLSVRNRKARVEHNQKMSIEMSLEAEQLGELMRQRRRGRVKRKKLGHLPHRESYKCL